MQAGQKGFSRFSAGNCRRSWQKYPLIKFEAADVLQQEFDQYRNGKPCQYDKGLD
jgi:hypothetical protein